MKAAAAVLLLFALSCFRKHPLNDNALLHLRACIEAIELNDQSRAQIHCELCLEFDSSMAECLNGMGLVAISNHDDELARNYFIKALRQNNDFSPARNNLGALYFAQGDFFKALNYFERSLEIDPSNADARYNAGLSHYRMAQKHLAGKDKASAKRNLLRGKDQMRKLLALEPRYANAHRDLGLMELALFGLRDFAEKGEILLAAAKKAFLLCLEIDAENDGCYEGLANVFFAEARFDEAFANYFLCLARAPDNAGCRQNIVSAYEKGAQLDGGYQRFALAVKKNAGDALAHDAFCAALFERKLEQQAIIECQHAIALKPDLCHAHYRLADHFALVFDGERAGEHCRAFLICAGNEPSSEIKRCQEILLTLRR